MKTSSPVIALLAAIALAAAPGLHAQTPAGSPPPRPPNIIFILMDDLGYGDVGKFWQNRRPAGEPSFRTPNWDRMADEGMMLMQHYCAAPVCAPSRASLLLGQHQGHCGLRNDEFDFPLPEDHTMATVLRQQGYYTAAIGKWGLGGANPPWPRHPFRCGFDVFYGYMRHKEGHFHYPGNNGTVMDGETPVRTGLDLAYTTDLWTAKAKQIIQEHTARRPDQPFFMYLAYDTPHALLKAPTQAYPPGGGLRGGLQWPLNTNSGEKDSYVYPEMVHAPWPREAKVQATMIRRDDECVGDLLQLLRDLHIDRNTLVVFTSDNGPMGEDGESPEYFQSRGPFDGMKRDVYEGGIHMPAIAWWPGHIAPGSASDLPSGLWDWLPTFTQAAGQIPPGSCDGVSLLPTLLGKGVQQTHPYLYIEYKGADLHERGAAEFFKRKGVAGRGEMQAVRLGNFMGLRYNIVDPRAPLRLYDLATDPHEDHDLALDPKSGPVLARMQPLLLTARDNVPGASRPYGAELLPAAKVDNPEAGLTVETYAGSWPWVPDYAALAAARQPVSRAVVPVPASGSGAPPTVEVMGGFVRVPADGEYTFYMATDGGGHLWVHDAHVIDDDYGRTGGEVSGTVFLQAGSHPVRIVHRHQDGAPKLVVSYAGPGIVKTTIPAAAFSHEGKR